MKYKIRGYWWVLAPIAVVTLPLRAHADVGSQIDDDVKGVIVDLVTANVETNVGPPIICRAGHVVETKSTTDPSVIETDKVRPRFMFIMEII